MSSPFDAVSSFQRTHRRANPEGAIMSGPEFLEWLSEEGYDMASFDEEDWRGMAEELGMGDGDTNAFMENVAGWLV
jgi:hypothetical protein